MSAAPNAGADLFAQLHNQLDRAFKDPPLYGSVGLVVHLVDGAISRVEYIRTESARILPRADRGGRI